MKEKKKLSLTWLIPAVVIVVLILWCIYFPMNLFTGLDEDAEPSVATVMVHVFDGEKEIGILSDVLDYPGNKVYVVKGEKEYMIPAVKAFVLDTDVDAGTMHVRLIEGMEINAD